MKPSERGAVFADFGGIAAKDGRATGKIHQRPASALAHSLGS
jgi:hypothetical protein